MGKQTYDLSVDMNQWTSVGTASKERLIENPQGYSVLIRISDTMPTSNIGHILNIAMIDKDDKAWVMATSDKPNAKRAEIVYTE